jgi:hypothetical protein
MQTRESTSPTLLKKRGVDSAEAMLALDRLEGVVQCSDAELHDGMQPQALQRCLSQCVMPTNSRYWLVQ